MLEVVCVVWILQVGHGLNIDKVTRSGKLSYQIYNIFASSQVLKAYYQTINQWYYSVY